MIKGLANFFRPPIGAFNESFRERWLEETLKSISEGNRILDAGAGTQRYKRYCPHLRYVSQDFGQYDGKGDMAALQTRTFDYQELDIVCDITSIPEPPQSFDAIMCIEVLEHLPDPVKAIAEFSRLLKPGGDLVLTAPFCSLTHMAPYHFVTGFNRYWYEEHLMAHGFEIREIIPNGNYYEYLGQEVRRVRSICKRYSNCKPHFYELACLYILRRMLYRFSRRDTNSSELLCYGYNVHARRGEKGA